VNRVFINILVFTSIVLVGPVSTFAREEGADLTMSLHQAIVNGDVNEVKSILSKGVDINAKNRRSWTPLHTAIDSKQNEIVQLLLDKNADVNLADNNGETSIHLAVKSGQKDIVELLIAKGADLNIVNTHSENALSLAKKAGHKEIAELLIKHGAKEPDLEMEMDRNRIPRERRAMERTGPPDEGERGIQRQPGQMQPQQEPERDILADANDIEARIKAYEGLEKSIEDVLSKSRIGMRHWQRITTDNRTSLVRVAKMQLDEEVELIKKVALEEKAKKTVDAADALMAKRMERTAKVLKEITEDIKEQRQSRAVSRGRSRFSGRGARGAGSQDGRYSGRYGRGVQSSNEQGGAETGAEEQQAEQPDIETQNEIGLWLRADAQNYDSKLDLANSVHQQTVAEYNSLRKVAEGEDAKKTIATIDGLLLERQRRLNELTKFVEEEKQKLEEEEQRDRTRAERPGAAGQETQTGSRRRRR
jgi:hypothetical protein